MPRKKNVQPGTRRRRGSGSIIHDERRGFRAQITQTTNGVRKLMQSTWFKEYDQAEEALTKLKKGEAKKAATRETVMGVVEAFILRKDGKPREETTLQRYRGLKRNIETIGDLRVERLTSGDIESHYAFLLEEGLAPTTVFHVHSLLSAACKWAKRRRIIAINPFDEHFIEAPKRMKSEATALSVADAKKIFANLDKTKFGNALLFCLATGMRRGEVCGLRFGAIDDARGIVNVRESRYQVVGEVGMKRTKTGQVREIHLNSVARQALDAEEKRRSKLREKAGTAWTETEFVFVDDLGLPVAPLALTNAFRVVAQHAGLYDGSYRYTLHSLRHTAATWMFAAGMEIHAVQKALGHSEASTTTNTYGHVVDGRVVVALDALAERIEEVRQSAHGT